MSINLNEKKVSFPSYGTGNNLGTLSIPMSKLRTGVLESFGGLIDINPNWWSINMYTGNVNISGELPSVTINDESNEDAMYSLSPKGTTFRIRSESLDKTLLTLTSGRLAIFPKDIQISDNTRGLVMYDRNGNGSKHRIFVEDGTVKVEAV